MNGANAQAEVRVALAGGSSRFAVCKAEAPWILRPLRERRPAVLYTGQLGGGFVQGDVCSMRLAVEAGAALAVFGQASSKVYPGASRLQVHAEVGAGAQLAWLGEPQVAYAGAQFGSATRVQVHPHGSLLWWESCTAGRVARGERWQAERLEARIELWRGERCEMVEAYRMTAAQAQRSAWAAFGSVLLVGRFAAQADALAAALGELALTSCARRGDVALLRFGLDEPGQLEHIAERLRPFARRIDA